MLKQIILPGSLFCLLAAQGMVFAADGKDLQIIQEQQAIAQISNPDSDWVTAWMDRDSLKYKPGEEVKFFVKSQKHACITLMNVGTSGKVHVVFPNEHQPQNCVKKGETVEIPGKGAPFAYQVSGPGGTEVVKVIATTQPLALFNPQNMIAAGPFKTFDAPAETVAKDLSIKLNELPKSDWAEYKKVFYIVAPEGNGTVQIQSSGPQGQSTSTPPAGWNPGQQIAVNPGGALINPTPPGATVTLTNQGVVSGDPIELRLRTDRDSYRLGETVSLYARTNRACNLTVVDIGTTGNVTILFPNSYQRNNLLQPGQDVIIPGPQDQVRFQLSGQPGMETIMGICTPTGVQAYQGQYDFSVQQFQVWGTQAQFSKDLSVVLEQQQPAASGSYAKTTLSVPVTN